MAIINRNQQSNRAAQQPQPGEQEKRDEEALAGGTEATPAPKPQDKPGGTTFTPRVIAVLLAIFLVSALLPVALSGRLDFLRDVKLELPSADTEVKDVADVNDQSVTLQCTHLTQLFVIARNIKSEIDVNRISLVEAQQNNAPAAISAFESAIEHGERKLEDTESRMVVIMNAVSMAYSNSPEAVMASIEAALAETQRGINEDAIVFIAALKDAIKDAPSKQDPDLFFKEIITSKL